MLATKRHYKKKLDWWCFWKSRFFLLWM